MCGPLHVRFQDCGHVLATGQTGKCQTANESQTICQGPDGQPLQTAVVRLYPGVCPPCVQTNADQHPQMQPNGSQARSDLAHNVYAQPPAAGEQEEANGEDSEEDSGDEDESEDDGYEDEEDDIEDHDDDNDDDRHEQQAFPLQSRSALGQYPSRQHPTQLGGPGPQPVFQPGSSNMHIPPQAYQPEAPQPQSQPQHHPSSSRQAWQRSLALEHERKLARARARAQEAEDRALAHDLETALAESRLSAQSREAADVANATAESRALAAAHLGEEETHHVGAAMLASLEEYTSELEHRMGRVSEQTRLVFTGCGHVMQKDGTEYKSGEVRSVPPLIHQQGLCDGCHARQYEGDEAGSRANRANVHDTSIQGSTSTPQAFPKQYAAANPKDAKRAASASVIAPRASPSQRPYYEPSESPTRPRRRSKKAAPLFGSSAPSVNIEVDEEVNRPGTPSVDAQQAALHRESEETSRQRLFAQAKAAEEWRRLHPEDGVTIVSDESERQNEARVSNSKARSRLSRRK